MTDTEILDWIEARGWNAMSGLLEIVFDDDESMRAATLFGLRSAVLTQMKLDEDAPRRRAILAEQARELNATYEVEFKQANECIRKGL